MITRTSFEKEAKASSEMASLGCCRCKRLIYILSKWEFSEMNSMMLTNTEMSLRSSKCSCGRLRSSTSCAIKLPPARYNFVANIFSLVPMVRIEDPGN